MHIELQCPACSCEFVHETALAGLRDQHPAEAELLHDALGDGGTVEDALHALSDAKKSAALIAMPTFWLREEDPPFGDDDVGFVVGNVW